MELIKLEKSFKSHHFYSEDDIKIHFHSDIVSPLLEELNPSMKNQYKSEDNLLAGGRSDATFQNIIFELKKHKYFRTANGIKEALRGRNGKDHGLYDYIISNSGISKNDTVQTMTSKLLKGIGVGFDGDSFVFARFVPSPSYHKLETEKLKINVDVNLPLIFNYESKDFSSGLKKLALLLKQQNKNKMLETQF